MGVGSIGRTRGRIFVALAVAIGLALPASASAAQTIGQTAPADGCTGGEAYTQGPLLASTYSPTAPGVITSWSSFAAPTANTHLHLLEPKPYAAGKTHFIAVWEDQARPFAQPG